MSTSLASTTPWPARAASTAGSIVLASLIKRGHVGASGFGKKEKSNGSALVGKQDRRGDRKIMVADKPMAREPWRGRALLANGDVNHAGMEIDDIFRCVDRTKPASSGGRVSRLANLGLTAATQGKRRWD
jgi:hypothetical protein